MKHLLTFILTSLFQISFIMAQVPAGFSYQAAVRNTTGELVTNQRVNFRFNILQNSAEGISVYIETQSVQTNAYGLANLVVGSGTKVKGNFDPAGWGNNSHFLKVELDPNNGNSFSHLGTMQLMAVPYAFHAKTAEEVSDNSVTSDKITDGAVTGAKIAQEGATNNQILKWNGTTWAPAADATSSIWQQGVSKISYSDGFVGIGTNTPTSLLTLNGNTNNTEIRLFNNSSGERQTLDGLTLGLNAVAPLDAWFWNRENGKIMLGTNNAERITITGDGKVGVNNARPEVPLDIIGNTKIEGALRVVDKFTVGQQLNKQDGSPPTSHLEIKGIHLMSDEIKGNNGKELIPYPTEVGSWHHIVIISYEIEFDDGDGVGEPWSMRGIKDGIWYDLTDKGILLHYPNKPDYYYGIWRVVFMII